MRSVRAHIGLILASVGASGCLGPDLGFVGGGGEGGTGTTTPATTSLAGTTTAATTGGQGGQGGAVATTTTSGPGGAGGTGGAGGAECEIAEDCPDTGDFCLDRTCDDATCGTTPLPDGLEVPAGDVGDCKRLVCEGGNTVEVDDDEDLPDDFNDCTVDACDGGTPSNGPAPADTPCGLNDDLFCDGAGTCTGCTDAGQCAGTDDDCKTRTCIGGECGVDFELPGTPATPAPGNCAEEVCDGAGNVTGSVDDDDLPVDGNDCTGDVCSGGIASNPDLEPGIPCGDGASCTEPPATAKAQDVCDGFGTCNVQVPQLCTVGSQCLVPACSGDVCGSDFAPEDTPCDFVASLDGFCDVGGTCVECTGDGQCQGTDVCASGTCTATEKIVFVTAVAVLPTFVGTAGGDAVCQTAATNAGLTGTFRAWLSDSGSSPAATFAQSTAPYRLVDGTTIANDWADLIDGSLLAGISVDQNGTSIPNAEVWTGTTSAGTAIGDDCSGWSTTAGTGFVGLSATTGTWSQVFSQFCDRNNVRLYCFEQ